MSVTIHERTAVRVLDATSGQHQPPGRREHLYLGGFVTLVVALVLILAELSANTIFFGASVFLVLLVGAVTFFAAGRLVDSK